MGSCFSKSKKNRGKAAKLDSPAKVHSATQRLDSNTNPKQVRAFESVVVSPVRILLNNEEINPSRGMIATDIYSRDNRQFNQINSTNPLRHVSRNVIKFTKNSEIVSAGLYIADLCIITSSKNRPVLTDESIRVESSTEFVQLLLEFSFESEQFLIFKTDLPSSFISDKAALTYIEESPSYSEPLNVLHYASNCAYLKQDTVFITDQNDMIFKLSKSFSKSSYGAPIFNIKNKLTGILVSSNKALNILHIINKVIDMPETENIPFERLIKEWKILGKGKDSSIQVGHDSSNMSSVFTKSAISTDLNRTVPKKNKETRQCSGTKFINPIISKLGKTPNKFAESCFYLSNSKLFSFNIKNADISETSISTVGKGYTITPCDRGVLILFENQCILWKETEIHELKSPSSRYINHSALVNKNNLLAIGGKYSKTVEALDLQSLEWQRYPDLPYKIQHASAISLCGTVYMIGGVKRSTASDDILTLADEWKKLDIKLPIGIAGLGTIVIQDCFYVFGGFNENGYNKKIWRCSIDGDYDQLQEEFPVESVFSGRQFARSDREFVGFSCDGKLVKFNNLSEKFALLNVPLNSEDLEQENYYSLLIDLDK